MAAPDPDTLTPADICRKYNVSRFSVHRWLKTGVRGVRLVGTMVGGRWHVERADLTAFFDCLTAAALPAAPAPAPAPAARRTRRATAPDRQADADIAAARRLGLID